MGGGGGGNGPWEKMLQEGWIVNENTKQYNENIQCTMRMKFRKKKKKRNSVALLGIYAYESLFEKNFCSMKCLITNLLTWEVAE